MFKKSPNSVQLNLYSSPVSLFSGKSLKLYEDKSAWHNQFRQQVTMRINENIFSPLFCQNNGTPNASVRVLVAMMVLKEAEGLSDQKLFENCRFNMLTRSAIGLINVDDPVPTDSTYYLFRKRIVDHAKAGNKNLLEVVFADITKNQCIDLEVSGKRIRMDSKLLGSNIAWLSRYEIIHETLRLFYNTFRQRGQFDIAMKERLDNLLKVDGNKVVYTSTSEEVKSRLKELGELIYKILTIFPASGDPRYQTLQTVFNEHFKVDEKKTVIARENAEIPAQSVQSPHDTDCNYRNKDGNKVKGYSINVTESCDDKRLNLIGYVDVRKASTQDIEFLQEDINKVQEVFPDKTEAAHVDGAYHSPDNQVYCKKNHINLYLNAIQGAKGRFSLDLLENGQLVVVDTKTNELLIATRVRNKKDYEKWRIKIDNTYRYFTRKDIDTYLLKKEIDETPVETLQKRNNVEATIFQLAYHYPNDKSRYRELIKHQMWANIRCIWVNFVRILKHIKQLCQRTSILAKYALKLLCFEFYCAFQSFVRAILPYHMSYSINSKISES